MLHIIIPFKSNTCKDIDSTLNSLCHLNSDIHIYIVYDPSSEIMLLDYLSKRNLNNLTSIEAFEKGIYSAINQALDMIPFRSFYIVLGAGEIFQAKSLEFISYNSDLIYLQYCLNTDLDSIISSVRPIYSGMPYCHNALIFRNCSLRYDQKYSISADYKYFLAYLKLHNVYPKNPKVERNISVIYENQNGISSKMILKKHLQNIKIIFIHLSIIYVFLYFAYHIRKFLTSTYD